jgi:uncharacterized protein YcfJ
MNKMSIAVAVGVIASTPVFAESFTETVPVLGVRPIVEQHPVNHRQCWNETRHIYEHTVTREDNGPMIGPGTVLGAVVGGVIGHQMGNSSGGRDRGTAAGAIVGGIVGNQVDRQNAPPPQPVTESRPVTIEKCEVVQEMREVTTGFEVRYRWNGHEFVTRMPYDPGRRVRVAVNIDPVVENPPPPPGYRR